MAKASVAKKVAPAKQAAVKTTPKAAQAAKSTGKSKSVAKAPVKPTPKVAVKSVKAPAKPAPKVAAKKPVKAPAKPAPKVAVKPVKAPAKPTPKVVIKAPAKPVAKATSALATKTPVKPEVKVVPKVESKVEVKKLDVTPIVPQKMNARDLAYFEQLLVEKRAVLVEELRSIEEANLSHGASDQGGENSGYTNHLADAASDYATLETNLGLADRDSKYLQNIEDALERVRKGSYGVCKLCGNLIEKKRLEAVPTATKHVDCKLTSKKMEVQEQQVELARQMQRNARK